MAWRVSLQSKSSATDDVVTGFEALNDGDSGVEAGREDVRLLAAFERGKPLFKRLVVGIAASN